MPLSKNRVYTRLLNSTKLLICVIFGEYVILIKNYSFSNKNYSLALYNEDSFTFSFLTAYKNQLKNAEILNALSSNHSPVFCSFVNNDTFVRRSDVWKFSNSLLFNADFIEKLKIRTEVVKSNLQEKSSFSDHTKWEFLKYEIHKFSIFFLQNLPKTERIIQTNFENRIKTLAQNL